ncbi:MAG: hypothetical protein JWO13_3121 [Acidobacteriales bacterium]|nr:hypothetical protein [Terriglobales bacterium]
MLGAALLLAGFTSDVPAGLVAYFQRVRNVTVSGPDKQNYAVLDEAIFEHARADLGDLRLFAGEKEIPYSLAVRSGSTRAEHSSVPILNKGLVRGNTQFVVDVGIPEYDNIRLDVRKRDYLAQVKVEGENEVDAKAWSDLGSFTIFDFSKEKLGNNSTIRLTTTARFRYLRLTITGPLVPNDISGTTVANLQEDKARYVRLSEVPSVSAGSKKTILTWNASDKVPLDRVHFDVDPSELNFRRNVSVFCENRLIMTDDLNRIRLVRKERKVESENLNVELAGLRCKDYRLEIENGDDPQLRINRVFPEMLEHRIYFNPAGAKDLKLYYGDEKRTAPVYDYAKLFEVPADSEVAQAQLQPDSANASFTGRPDDRPFTERHPAILWAAMIVAIGALGAWAMKGFKP